MRDLKAILDDVSKLPEGSDLVLSARADSGGVRFQLSIDALERARELAEELHLWYCRNFNSAKFITTSLIDETGEQDIFHFFADRRE